MIVPLGFDGHWLDPLGNLQYTLKGYKKFFKWIKRLAEKYCGGKVCFVFEGGYNPHVVAQGIELLICTFTNNKPSPSFDNYVQDIYSNTKDTQIKSAFFQIEFQNAQKKVNKALNTLRNL